MNGLCTMKYTTDEMLGIYNRKCYAVTCNNVFVQSSERKTTVNFSECSLKAYGSNQQVIL